MWVSEEVRASQEETLLQPSRALLTFWDALRAGRPAPGRDDLDLKQLPRLVPYLFIAESRAPQPGFTWRLAGTGLCQFLRREVTGGDVLAGWNASERGVLQRFLAGVTAARQQAVLRLRYRTDRDQLIAAELLALPMTARDGVSTHVLGGIFPVADPQIKHYDEITPVDVTSARFLDAGATYAAAPAVHAARRFRVIPGGLDRA